MSQFNKANACNYKVGVFAIPSHQYANFYNHFNAKYINLFY